MFKIEIHFSPILSQFNQLVKFLHKNSSQFPFNVVGETHFPSATSGLRYLITLEDNIFKF
jgi:hypothetical protein